WLQDRRKQPYGSKWNARRRDTLECIAQQVDRVWIELQERPHVTNGGSCAEKRCGIHHVFAFEHASSRAAARIVGQQFHTAAGSRDACGWIKPSIPFLT